MSNKLILFYSVIPSQFGQVPDVAFEEIKQMRSQHQLPQQPVSLPFYAPVFASTINSPSINSPTSDDSLFLTSNQSRLAVRDAPVNHGTGTTRSRSLASNANRPSAIATSTKISNLSYQTPSFTTNKQAFSTPTRFGLSRLNPSITTINNSLVPESTASQNTNANDRNLPINSSPSIKQRNNQYRQPATVARDSLHPSSTTKDNKQQRTSYETTYQASFIKPLVP